MRYHSDETTPYDSYHSNIDYNQYGDFHRYDDHRDYKNKEHYREYGYEGPPNRDSHRSHSGRYGREYYPEGYGYGDRPNKYRRGGNEYYKVPPFIKYYYFTGNTFPKPGQQPKVGSPTTYCLASSCLTNPYETSCYPQMAPSGLQYCTNARSIYGSSFNFGNGGYYGSCGGNHGQFF